MTKVVGSLNPFEIRAVPGPEPDTTQPNSSVLIPLKSGLSRDFTHQKYLVAIVVLIPLKSGLSRDGAPTMRTRRCFSLNPFEIRAVPGRLSLKNRLLKNTCKGCYGLFRIRERCLCSACPPWLVACFSGLTAIVAAAARFSSKIGL